MYHILFAAVRLFVFLGKFVSLAQSLLMVVHISAATQRFVDSFCLLFGGIQTEFEPFIRSQLAPPFLGHPHDLSNTPVISMLKLEVWL